MNHSVITFAHRGARLEYPENTLRAFRRARELGASGLESDVWLSADGEVVCTHDATVRSGVRRVRVEKATAVDLARLEVPRLADVYDELGTDYDFSIDVKTPEAAAPLVDVARKFGALERLWVCSPDLELLVGLRPEPAVRLVHSTSKRAVGVLERHAHDLSEAGIDAMNMHHTEWSAGLVSLFHRFGVRAFAWDAQEVRHLRAMLRMEIDGVYCDRPDRMVATVGEWTAGPMLEER
ncbi:MAG: glycerophosphodiester phosphodiesterase [Actinomycetota bacterium]|nr:glycerophosphodiester phosphodiesterase [Actinomycetota bacterium]